MRFEIAARINAFFELGTAQVGQGVAVRARKPYTRKPRE
jgi:hypothetical protein